MIQPENDAERKLVADIEGFGWHIISVLADDDGPAFSYTVGLYRNYRHPEIIIAGLPYELAQTMLNIAGEAIREGRQFHAGESYDDFLEGFSCTFREVPPEKYRHYGAYAMWFYDGESFPAMQLIYPDDQKRLPWEEGVSAEFRAFQPVIADDPEPLWASGAEE